MFYTLKQNISFYKEDSFFPYPCPKPINKAPKSRQLYHPYLSQNLLCPTWITAVFLLQPAPVGTTPLQAATTEFNFRHFPNYTTFSLAPVPFHMFSSSYKAIPI